MIHCPNCGAANADGTKFCAACGTPINSIYAENPYSLYANPPEITDEPKKKRSVFKTILVIVLALVLVAGALIAAFKFLPFFNKKPNYALYFKNDELYYTGLRRIDPVEIAGDTNWNDLYNMPRLTGDGKHIVFIDDIEDGYEGYGSGNLYILDAKDPDSEPVKIKSEVEVFFVIPGDKYIVYYANESLYQYNIKKGTNDKIEKEAELYGFSEDGKYLIYLTEEEVETEDEGYEWQETWFIKELDSNDSTKIAEDVEDFQLIDMKFKEYCYISDGDLYIAGPKTEKTKIDSDVATIYTAFETGEIYYGIGNESEDKDEDYYHSYSYFDSYTLYYYDGNDSTEVCDNLENSYCSAASRSNAVAAFRIAEDEDESTSDYDDDYYDYYDDSEEETHYIVVSYGEMKELDETDIRSIYINGDGSEVYYLADCEYEEADEEDYYDIFISATLYKLEITKKGIGSATSQTDDVHSFRFVNEEDYCYYTNFDSEEYTGDLYINGDFVDSDVVTDGEFLRYNNDSSCLYATDYDEDNDTLTLKLYNGKKSVKVADDVIMWYWFTPHGDILYITDWDDEENYGDLYVFDGKDSEKIDDEVSFVVPDFDCNNFAGEIDFNTNIVYNYY